MGDFAIKFKVHPDLPLKGSSQVRKFAALIPSSCLTVNDALNFIETKFMRFLGFCGIQLYVDAGFVIDGKESVELLRYFSMNSIFTIAHERFDFWETTSTSTSTATTDSFDVNYDDCGDFYDSSPRLTNKISIPPDTPFPREPREPSPMKKAIKRKSKVAPIPVIEQDLSPISIKIRKIGKPTPTTSAGDTKDNEEGDVNRVPLKQVTDTNTVMSRSAKRRDRLKRSLTKRLKTDDVVDVPGQNKENDDSRQSDVVPPPLAGKSPNAKEIVEKPSCSTFPQRDQVLSNTYVNQNGSRSSTQKRNKGQVTFHSEIIQHKENDKKTRSPTYYETAEIIKNIDEIQINDVIAFKVIELQGSEPGVSDVKEGRVIAKSGEKLTLEFITGAGGLADGELTEDIFFAEEVTFSYLIDVKKATPIPTAAIPLSASEDDELTQLLLLQ